MRNLNRNRRGLYYATVVGKESVYDEYGNETLEEKKLFSSPTLLRANVSANVGEDVVEVFGSQTEYARVVSIVGASCPLTVGDRVWFGVTSDQQYNYTVAKVADSKNGFLVALREVSPRG